VRRWFSHGEERRRRAIYRVCCLTPKKKRLRLHWIQGKWGQGRGKSTEGITEKGENRVRKEKLSAVTHRLQKGIVWGAEQHGIEGKVDGHYMCRVESKKGGEMIRSMPEEKRWGGRLTLVVGEGEKQSLETESTAPRVGCMTGQ